MRCAYAPLQPAAYVFKAIGQNPRMKVGALGRWRDAALAVLALLPMLALAVVESERLPL
jgi:hypothetical protein